VKISHSLYMQTLGMVLFYLLTLCAIVFIGFNAQFGIGWEALLKSPIGDRVDTIADAISSNLQASDQKNWTEILNNFEKLYNVQFYIFDMHGEQLAGKSLTLPAQLKERVIEFPPGMPLFAAHHAMDSASPGRHRPSDRPVSFAFRDYPNGHNERAFPPPPDDRFEPPEERVFRAPPDIRLPHFEERGSRVLTHDRFPAFYQGGIAPLSGLDGNSVLQRTMSVHTLQGHPFMHAQGRFVMHTENPDTFFIGTKVFLFDTKRMRPMPSVVIASTNKIWQSTLLFDFNFLFLIASLILLASLIFWWPFVHQLSRSIGELTALTEKIAEGKFDARILSNRGDELGRLGDAVNSMAQKLQEYVSSQKRFLADISHELFSPLARLHMAVELMESCKPEDAPRHFREINEEIDEMKSLINELLAYSKAGMKQTDTSLVPLDLTDIIEVVVSKFADQHAIEVSLAANSIVLGDALLLSRSFSNIIRNSIRYAGQAPITITSTTDGTHVLVDFSDSGPGVPEETLKHLGEPFFRPEFSRNRNFGGFGLGLAIVKSCIEACNGTVTLSNRPEGGLNVRLQLNTLPRQIVTEALASITRDKRSKDN
jgi:two-component system, OmpR family, sensor histidine kinase CpxA